MLVPLTDCAKGVGIGLDKANVITQLNPGGAAARSGLLQLGDHVVVVDGATLGGRALRDALRPAEVVRGMPSRWCAATARHPVARHPWRAGASTWTLPTLT